MNLKICYLKIDVSCEASINLHHVSQNATPAMVFLVSISRSPDNAIRQEHATRHVRSVAPATQNDDGGLQSAAPWKMQLIFSKRRESIAQATQNDFRHVMKNVGMSQSTTPATWNKATRRLKPPKVTTFAELAIGTAILSTVADGCGRRSGVERTRLHPQTPKVKREPFATHSGKITPTLRESKNGPQP